MSTANYHVEEHVLPCSYVREYPRAVRNEEDDVLHMHIKRYTPISNVRPEPYDVTFIAAHANGVPKEMYEPLWDELLAYSRKTKKFRIRSIWIADVAHQGQSSVLNEKKLGNDRKTLQFLHAKLATYMNAASWYDHPRDLFLMINHFRKAMPRPLVGIGHSMGGNNILNLSLMHPRLFTSVIMLDPVVASATSRVGNYSPAYASSFRRDLWPSRAAAREAFLKNAFYKSWDPRAFDLWIDYGLRDLPTELYPEGTVIPASKSAAISSSNSTSATPVTLTTTKHQEVFSFLRGKHPAANQPMSSFSPTPASHPDIPTIIDPEAPFYSTAPILTHHQLPHLRPSCVYILGSKSPIISRELLDHRLAITGAGVGGSGGVSAGNVKEIVADGGHFFPFESPSITALHVGQWMDERIPQFRRDEAAQRAQWAKVKDAEKSKLSADRLWWTKKDLEAQRVQAKSGSKL